MKTILKLSLLLMLFAPLAHGQGPIVAGAGPVVEAGIGYSYVSGIVPSEARQGLNGAQVMANADLSRRLGVKLDVGYARTFDSFNTGRSADLLTYMAGPVFYPVRRRRTNVYTHLLLGAARQTGANFDNTGRLMLGYVHEFAWAGGAGVQFPVSRSLSLRMGADYLQSHFFDSNVVLRPQSNLRGSVSLIYTFGERRE